MREVLEDFDPHAQQDPVRDLTLRIRALRMGDSLQMPDGTVVRSTVMRHGPNRERRFAVVPPEDKSTPKQRHQALVMGRSVFRNAEETAKKVLDIK